MTPEKRKELELRIASLTTLNEEEEINRDEYILMANYLSEIEGHQNKVGWRKELAQKIGTSASYLTQVFTGNKPLNFRTIAKIQKALNVRFRVELIDMALWVISTSNMPSAAIKDLSKLPPTISETTIANIRDFQQFYATTKEPIQA